MMSDAYIQVRNLSKVFGLDHYLTHNKTDSVMAMIKDGISKSELLEKTGFVLGLNHINFDIEQGETFVIMGLSGSGKSTLIRHFNCLNRPTHADALSINRKNILDFNLQELQQFRAHHISMVFQSFAIFPNLSVLDNIAFGLQAQGLSPDKKYKRAQHWVEKVGLNGFENKKPGQLSGGMQQRVGSARAFATNADILLMDEPFSALDPIIRKQMQDELIELKKTDQRTIIFITHDLDEALKLGDRIAILDEGNIIQIGSPKDILTNPSNNHIRTFISGVNRLQALKADDVAIGIPEKAYLPNSLSTQAMLKQLQQASLEYGFIIDHQDRYLGLVTLEDLEKHSGKRGKIKPNHRHSAQPKQSLESMLPLITLSSYPLAITHENGAIIGQCSKQSVLETLSLQVKQLATDTALDA